MKYAFMASVFALGLAACGGGGGGGKAALVKSCTAEGESQENCVCMADAAEKQLDKPLFNKLIKAAENGEDGVEALIGELSAEEQGKFMGFAMSASMSCGLGG